MRRFSNYRNLKIDENLNVELVHDKYELTNSLILLKHAISCRDHLIAAELFKHNVDFLIDIGCDFGSLLAAAKKNSIQSLGLDIDKTALNLCKTSKLNAVKYSIEKICKSKTLSNFIPEKSKISAVSCLNILHSQNFDVHLRKQLIKIMLREFDFVVISVNKKTLKKLNKQHNFHIVSFVSQINKPISRINSVLQQYGTTFYFKNILLHNLEYNFWKLIFGHYVCPNPINSYLRMTVIIRRN